MQTQEIYKSIIAGSISGMTSVIICHPLDTIRTRLQTSPKRFNGFFHSCYLTLRYEGINGFYRGFFPPFISQGLYKAVIFTSSDYICRTLNKYTSFANIINISISGAVAGGINSFIVTPVELIRNRLQIQCENDK